jgi:hypothetical protein
LYRSLENSGDEACDDLLMALMFLFISNICFDSSVS